MASRGPLAVDLQPLPELVRLSEPDRVRDVRLNRADDEVGPPAQHRLARDADGEALRRGEAEGR